MAAVTTAVVGIASAATSTAMSFSAAAKAKREGEAAAAEAKKAMEEAKKKAETDFYEGLSVPLDAYDAEFENNLAVAQQSTEALQEGDARALAAGVGRVGAQAGAQAQETRIAMGEQISDLQATKAQSKDAVNQQLLQMDVANAKEQKQIARESEAARSAAIGQGIQGIGSTIGAVAAAAPLFPGGGATPPPGGINTGNPLDPNMIGGSNYTPPSLSLSSPSSGLSLSGGNNSIFSDRRLKENISLIGKSKSGLNIYTFKYKGKEGVYQGVMSDEVPQEAVIKSGGYDMVNYSTLDVEFKEI